MMCLETLEALAASLRAHPNVAAKLEIASAYSPALGVTSGIALGDDAAAIPDVDGFLLLAAEGMMESFIELDPWFAGYCAVMVNLSDIAAMGGSPTALVDVIWAHETSPMAQEIWAGMRAASEAYGVPIVGGHTTRVPAGRTPLLAAAVVGRARRLITSFDAKPGDTLLMAVDLRGAYRGDGTVFWNASVGAPPEQLRCGLRILRHLAEAHLVTAGKDISNGGVLGTLAMLLATSQVGAVVDLDQLPMPPGVELGHWLLSFPSYGYLLTSAPEKAPAVRAYFEEKGIAFAEIGTVVEGSSLMIRSGDAQVKFTEVAASPAATSRVV